MRPFAGPPLPRLVRRDALRRAAACERPHAAQRKNVGRTEVRCKIQRMTPRQLWSCALLILGTVPAQLSCRKASTSPPSPAATKLAVRPPSPANDSQARELNEKYFGALAEVTMISPKYFIADFWYTRFHAEGAWVMDDGELAWPVNSGSISCDRSTMECTDITAFVFKGLLNSDVTHREVERWDAHEIITKPNDATCVRSTLRINREQQSVTETQNTFRTDGPCKGLTVAEHRLHLEDGNIVANHLREERLKKNGH